MELLVVLVVCGIISIGTQMVLYRRSAFGDMYVEWDDENHSWKCNLEISSTIDYSKKRKLVFIIKNKPNSRK